jgi:hypothetical protein
VWFFDGVDRQVGIRAVRCWPKADVWWIGSMKDARIFVVVCDQDLAVALAIME